MAKPKIALYWAASCGGCEIAQLEIGVKILKLAEAVDIVFWPVAIDVKYKDVEAMPDKSIDACLMPACSTALSETRNRNTWPRCSAKKPR